MLTFEINNLRMETIRLQFQPNLKDKIMSFLDSLPSKEVEITLEDQVFEHNKKVLHARYDDFKAGKIKTDTFEEFENLSFEETKKRVAASYDNLKSGKSQLYDIEDLEAMLDELTTDNES